MKKLSTIQKRENLNEVFAVDEKGNGGANHIYKIKYNNVGGYDPNSESEQPENSSLIKFQNGARKESGSIHGVIDSDLIEIVKHRLEAFQAGPFSSRENAIVLTHLEEALMWMNRRVEDRIERNVLGTNQK